MPIFGKRSEATQPKEKKKFFGKNRSSRHVETYPMHSRPTFGQWIKHTWLDLVTMAVMGAVGLGVYYAKPAPARSFPITFQDGEIVYPQFAYPLRGEIIPIWLAAFLASMIPIFIVLCMQFRVRSFWDVNNAVIGILYSLITAAVFQVFIKWLIGGLRPHFLTVCKPDISLSDGQGYNQAGFNQLFFTPDICTGDQKQINDALEAMPSGHTTAAFAGFIYLYFYLNAKLKVFSNYHPAMWKLIVLYMPVLGAVLIGGALTIDKYHNWYDVVAGAFIGTMMAYSSYRMTYAAVWDFRYNHIPLNRLAPFDYTGNNMDLADTVFTRKAGWGDYGGAGIGGEGHMNGHGHGHGHSNGFTNGHSNGFANGHNNGFSSGHAHNGHHDGFTNGHGINGHSTNGYDDVNHSVDIPRRPVGTHAPEHMV